MVHNPIRRSKIHAIVLNNWSVSVNGTIYSVVLGSRLQEIQQQERAEVMEWYSMECRDHQIDRFILHPLSHVLQFRFNQTRCITMHTLINSTDFPEPSKTWAENCRSECYHSYYRVWNTMIYSIISSRLIMGSTPWLRLVAAAGSNP